MTKTLGAPAEGRFAAGGSAHSRVLDAIKGAESDIFELLDELDVPFALAVTEASGRVFRCPRDGHLLTDRFGVDPESVERIAGRSAASGSTISESAWEVVSRARQGRPGRHLRGDRFYTGKYYRVSARWGWLSVPGGIETAATIASRRIYDRENNPLGVADGDAGIYITREDSDVVRLLRNYVPLATAS
ncbi:MAG: hypothetical protein F4Y57_06010 [Acidobacteria bacterium]|nr:hypothetical protein [Acidobacteriota bacterium]